MIYIISNCKWLTQEMIDSLDIKEEDKIVFFNKAQTLPLFKKFATNNLILFQRWSGNVYHGEWLAEDMRFKDVYLYGRGVKSKNYIKKLRKLDPERKVTIINHLEDVGLDCLGELNFSPFVGTLGLIYFDKHFPNEEKVLVGFTSFENEKILSRRKNASTKMHDNNIDRKVILDYCFNKKHIFFKYCCLNKKKNGLIDQDPLEKYEPTKTYGLISIEK